MQTFLRSLLALGFSLTIAACGGGGGGGHSSSSSSSSSTTSTTPTGDNVQAISVNPGLTGSVNMAFTSVTICVAGTSSCQTIDNIAIDTGSSGLRVLASALNGLSLQQQMTAANHPLAECLQFLDLSHVWGSVKLADVKIAGKIASSVPIQVVGDSSLSNEPVTCGNGDSSANMDTVAKLGGNGILGVSNFQQDCGDYCAINATNNYYYDCPSSTCTQTTAALASQVQNPIAFFSSDNNGVIIQLPAVSNSGAASVSGWMIFGIGTRDNNALGSAKVFTTSDGYITTRYKNTDYPQSFIDSGSNGLFFPDLSIASCSSATGFYCPSSTLNLSGTITGDNGASSTISFSVANTEKLNGSLAAFSNLAGYYGGGFDWGLPFFYGRKVFTALETNPGGPYVAF